ncbi:MAG: selenocysteinyl-tRNA(Sec) synthase [Comamonadaceae bacterium]|nr:selenocysteinyl-tRNA(Sec) synthase [Comamonadaceae bacterium]
MLVSRGELVEIGGAFRMPDIMKTRRLQAGRGRHHQPHPRRATTRRAVGAAAAAADRQGAHQQLRGDGLHRQRCDDAELARIAHAARRCRCVVDLGSGALVDLSALRPAARSRVPQDSARRRRRRRHLQRRQAARRPAGRASSSARRG